MASISWERLILTLAFTSGCQPLSLFYLWIRLRFSQSNAHCRAGNFKFTSIRRERFLLGIISSGVLFFTVIPRPSLNPPNAAFVGLLGIAVVLDAWIERYPMELSIASILLGWIASPNAVALLLGFISTTITFGLGSVIFGFLIRLTGRKVIAWGDVMFAAALSSRYGFTAGLSALSSAMIFAGLSSFIIHRIDPKVRTIPLIPLMALAFSVTSFFPNVFSFGALKVVLYAN